MKVFKRIIPELLRFAIIGAFLVPFVWAASGDKLSFQSSPGNDCDQTAGQDNFRIDDCGRIAEADDEGPIRYINLALDDFKMSAANIGNSRYIRRISDSNGGGRAYSELSKAVLETGELSSSLILAGVSQWAEIKDGGSVKRITYAQIEERLSPVHISFRVPHDFYASGTHGWKVIAMQDMRQHTTSQRVWLDYDYFASQDNAADDARVNGTRQGLDDRNSYREELTLSASTALAAGEIVTLRLWRAKHTMSVDPLKIMRVAFYYQSRY